MGSNISLALNFQDPSTWQGAARLLNEYGSVRDLFAGDFYPLTPYSAADAAWMAWQFDRVDLGKGLLQAFRRTESDISTRIFRLRGLDAKATYEVEDLDGDNTEKITGATLMEHGLEVQISSRPGAVTIVYRHIQ